MKSILETQLEVINQGIRLSEKETLEDIKDATLAKTRREFTAWLEEKNGAQVWEIEDWFIEKMGELI